MPLALLLGLASALAQAQPQARAEAPAASPAARPDPLNPQAAVPALAHTSSFAAYRRHAEAEPIGWREANDTVARIGGWRAYAREAAVAPAAASAAGTGSNAPSGARKP